MNLKGMSLVIGLFFLAGCATSGTDLHIVQEGYNKAGRGLRVTDVGNSNFFEPTFQYTVLEKCKIDTLVETVTYEIEDEDTLLTETVTETIEHKVPKDCEIMRVDHVSSPGFLPGMVGSALNAAGIAYAGYAIGDGIKNAEAESTSIDNSSSNDAELSNKSVAKGGNASSYAKGGNASSYSKSNSKSNARAKASAKARSKSTSRSKSNSKSKSTLKFDD